MTEPLSPAAKAVLVAEAKSRCLREQRECHPTDSDWNGCWICVHRNGIAAALRAAAINKDKQIDVPFSSIDQWEEIRGRTLSYWTAAQWGYTKAMNDLLAIAAELEDGND
jgi:hypothetical protein